MCYYRIQRTTENNHRGVFELNCATVPLLNELIAIKAYEVLDSTKEKSSYNVEYNYSDIAKEIGIGEATIYRYFGSKTKLVIEVGISLWEDVFQELSILKINENGYESVKQFF